MEGIISELRSEVKTLKEQLEQEKKAGSDVKSLKTQQICTLTFKLANAVRQRELAEEELAKVKKEMEELKEVMEAQNEELKAKEEEGGNDGSGKQEVSVPPEGVVEETGEVDERENIATDTIFLSFPEKDERNGVDDFVESGEVSLSLDDKCDKLSNDNSLHEDGSTEVQSQDIPRVVGLLSSSLELSDENSTKENLSFQDKSEDVFQPDASLQSSLSGLSYINEENPREHGEELEKIREDVCKVQENAIKISNTSYELVEDMEHATAQKNTLETLSPCSMQNHTRIPPKFIEEDQNSSPLTSSNADVCKAHE